MKRTYIITLLFSLCSLFMYAQDSRFDKFADMEEVTSVYISKAMLSLMPDMQTEGVNEELMRIKDKGEKTTIYLKQDKNKKKEFVLMTGEKNEFTVIIITGNLTLKEIQGIVNKE